MTRPALSRRTLLAGAGALAGSALLGGCDRLSNAPWFRHVLKTGEDANLFVQRLLLKPAQLAPEYGEADLSRWFKPNGTSDPPDKDYKALAQSGFSGFRLVVDGLVDRPLHLSLDELRAMPSRTQITRHDCVEGWSCIGKWTGVPVLALLEQAGLKPQARFVVFHCADTMEGGDKDAQGDQADADDDAPPQGGRGGTNPGMRKGGGQSGEQDVPSTGSGSAASGDDQPDGEAEQGGGTSEPSAEDKFNEAAGRNDSAGRAAPSGGNLFSGSQADGPAPVRYYESIDLEDAAHPQTILAYAMNGEPLPVAHGAPLRLRLERQLGYKMAKYVLRLEVVESLERFGGGQGGYWEDRGYEWYAGI